MRKAMLRSILAMLAALAMTAPASAQTLHIGLRQDADLRGMAIQ
jgi:hypothetical protein